MLRMYPLSDAATTDHADVSDHLDMVLDIVSSVDSLHAMEEWDLAGPGYCVTGTEGSAVQDSVQCSTEGVAFADLVAEWHRERGITSAVNDMVSCPSYQRIIGLGPDVLPAIFAQLRQEGDDPDHWFPALEAITGANPVSEGDFGDLAKMADAWLVWATDQYVY